MIKDLEQATSMEEIIKVIKDFFKKYDSDYYIPAIFQEGNFTYSRFEKENNKPASEFYSKLIIRPANSKITHSWLIQNLSYGFYDGYDFLDKQKIANDDFIYNLIVHKTMYNNSIYTFNPMLYNDDSSISEENYKNNEIANLFYVDSLHSRDKIPVLRKEKNNIYILKEVLKDFLQSNYSPSEPNYILSVEFEYRNTNIHINEKNNYEKEKVFIDNVAVEKNEFLWLIGTIDIPFIMKKEESLNITVNDLNGKIRKLNEKNYNDDTDAGLIVFSNKCFEYLKKRYIILGLTMLDTHNYEQSFIIDNLDDIFVFWEGEFNKLPRDVKVELQKYNDRKRNKTIISPAMFEWQLNASWDWKNKGFAYQLLGSFLIENHLDLVKEYKCNVVLPNNNELFAEEMKLILKVLSLKITDIAKPEKGYSTLTKIYQGKNVDLKKEEMLSLFEYFAQLVLEKVDNEYVGRISKTNE